MVIHDPAQGRRMLSFAEVSKHFTGVALELTPTPRFVPKIERQRVTLAHLLGPRPGIMGAVLQIVLLAGVLEVFGVISPLFIQLVVDSALVSEDRPLLTVLGVGFLLLALLQVGITAARSWAVLVLGTMLNLHLVHHLFRHLLRLPMSFFAKRHLGDVVSRFESLNTIQRTLTTSFLEAMVDGLMALTTLVMLLLYSGQLGSPRLWGRCPLWAAPVRPLWPVAAGARGAHCASRQAAVQPAGNGTRGPEREVIGPPAAPPDSCIRTCWSTPSTPGSACTS